MLGTLLEIIIFFAVVAILLVVWPSATSWPLPDQFISLWVEVVSRFKLVIELPIVEHLWWWCWF